MPDTVVGYTKDQADLDFAKQGGNSLGAPLAIGTNDAENMTFSVDGALALTLEDGTKNALFVGDVGIGTVAPLNPLDVAGGAVIGSGFAGVETAPANGLAIEGNLGVGTVPSGADVHVKNALANVNVKVQTDKADGVATLLLINDVINWGLRVVGTSGDNFQIRDATNSKRVLSIEPDASNDSLYIDAGGNVGFSQASPLGRIHPKVADTEALPVVALEQLDLSEEMFEFITTIGVGNPVEAIAAKTLTTTHFIKVTLPGALTRYIPCGTIA